ncbi:AraC family transcriptional regulator [Mesobaculum littorinae]|uniref:AraC family transcriptional regulator n=1 Tax=Mesobaculum littorinae TaxID=2486419 RepID=UPI001F291E92|nr:AraC family transcriptional regulator [Mesobaculum littorinae]
MSTGSATPGPVCRVGLVVYPGFKTLEATGPLSVLRYANEHLRAAGQAGGYEVTVMAPEPGHVPSDTLMTLDATAPLPEGDLPGTVFVAGAAGIEAALEREAALVSWCRRNAPRTDRFAALCTGSFFLAAAGLLDGKTAATHWNYADRLRQIFPQVTVDADAIFLRHGNLWTSAGVTAAIDLSLAFVEQDYGRDIALRVARRARHGDVSQASGRAVAVLDHADGADGGRLGDGRHPNVAQPEPRPADDGRGHGRPRRDEPAQLYPRVHRRTGCVADGVA